MALALSLTAGDAARAGQPDAGEIELAQAAGAGQPAIRFAIVIPATILAEPGAETALLVQVTPQDALPRHSFVRIRGLPQRVALSEGFVVAPGAWAVPLAALATLKAVIPVGTQGRADVAVSLVDLDGRVLADARTTLVIGQSSLIAPPKAAIADTAAARPPPPAAKAEPAPAAQVSTAVAPSQAVPAADPKIAAARPPRLELTPTPRPAAPIDSGMVAAARAEAERLVLQGDKFVGQGDIAVARNYYTRAADAGLALGAMRLAETYDPAVLAQLPVRGVQPNPDEARKWYERARLLGAGEASERIERLSSAR